MPLGSAVSEEMAPKVYEIEHLTIFGAANSVNDIPGSAHELDQQELDKFSFTDIMRTLTSVPGVYVLEEDGYGLRPNIGMRGTGQNRSEKVTIMEDGVLAAPAPYSAPSAYYFPTVGRMQKIEVLKGTSSAMYGPRTTGGVINMLSRQIPYEELAGQLALSYGSDDYKKLHAFIGGSNEDFGGVAEVFRYQADGFRDINHSDTDTGFIKNDLLSKFRMNFGSSELQQSLEFKLKYSDEDSNETYMGLNDVDFAENPFARYSASQRDNMKTTHKQVQINHQIHLSDKYTLGTTAYYNDFSRNWYKVSKVNGLSLESGGVDAASAFDNAPGDATLAIDVKANNRDYLSKGIQSTLFADLASHQLKVGARYHEDEMDRFQWVDKYSMDAQFNMSLSSAGTPGSDSNLIDSAKAFAAFIHDEFSFDDFILNTGLRYESMDLDRSDWGKSDPLREAVPTYKDNTVDVWLPSIAMTYRYHDDLVLTAGVQKGFAPPAPGNKEAENEESINYELGLRYKGSVVSAEALYFYSDYDNMHGNCTASQGCEEDNIGDQYNAGEVNVSGLELKAGAEWSLDNVVLPVSLTYTYTDTEFKNSFTSQLDTWGDVTQGDALPYVPRNLLQLSAELIADKWSGGMILRYTGEMLTQAGSFSSNTNTHIPGRTVVDFTANYKIDDKQKVILSVDNLFDKEYLSTRVHGSLMAGKPRTIILSYNVIL
ncbi:TonB-dependent receptor [Paraneptunicella aestuarii]|uniref:TonB-dependent receptor family protein n=1 Tax=Paraneptunicella aestuarii TaxID=2831148 RepID=UPI001E448B2C|nr:TonB-dependent receptor [Paraneptunicella aestuarii]UAA40752.1 TonB-dependent receptor [Paraneptunicella aestuarii]